MKRPLYILGLVCALAAIAATAQAARLNGRVEIRDDVIRLGDLFEGAGQAAGVVVGKAPAPGKRRMIDSRQLFRIAHDARLGWRPENRMVSTMVHRASRVVGPEEITEALREALADQGVSGELDIRLSNHGVRVHVSPERSPGFRLSNLRYDLNAGRFSAALQILGPDGPYGSIRIGGRVYSMVELPVLSRRMRPGEIIRQRDIQILQVRAQRLARGAIQDPAAMVGLTPRRYQRPGVPVRRGDLRTPVVVPKGSLVTLSLRTRTMALTVKARALQDGAMGDTIRVVNTRSHKTVEAVVVGAGQVAVPSQDYVAVAIGGTR